MFLATANLFFRDVKYLVDVILTFGIFFTPVFYEIADFGDKAKILMINPMAPLLESLNACAWFCINLRLLGWLLYSAIFSVVMFIIWLLHSFKKMEPIFAESI